MLFGVNSCFRLLVSEDTLPPRFTEYITTLGCVESSADVYVVFKLYFVLASLAYFADILSFSIRFLVIALSWKYFKTPKSIRTPAMVPTTAPMTGVVVSTAAAAALPMAPRSIGAGVVLGVGVIDGVTEGVILAVGVTEGVGVRVIEGVADGDGVIDGVAVGVRVGVFEGVGLGDVLGADDNEKELDDPVYAF
jgi:hypothetical protein